MRTCRQTVYGIEVEAGLRDENTLEVGGREGGEEGGRGGGCVLEYNTSMMDVVYMWCSGASFADVCGKSSLFEGRC